MATPAAHDWTTVANLIDCFELARRDGHAVDLAEFLPEATHPLYREVAAELIRVDLEYSWTECRPKRLDEYREIAPDLFAEPALLLGAAYEEYRLRRLAGERAIATEYAERFGVAVDDWPIVEPADLSRSTPGRIDESLQFPNTGELFAGFRLVSVIGRGAFSTVYLAEQADLARRYVALKISNTRSLEPQHLARLQHTNIVPIYSVHEADGLLAVCMPYFGDRTLADVMAEVASREQFPGSGQAFMSTIAARQEDTIPRTKPRPSNTANRVVSPRRETSNNAKLARLGYVDSVLTLAAALAAGLDHAHQRGIVHRDIKPANILVTEEGCPLLLDFNLSDELIVNGKESLAVGGTLPYMAPEHLRAVRDGRSIDAQSDLFSLGVIMYELLAGHRPFPLRNGELNQTLDAMIQDRAVLPAPLRRFNPSVPPSVDAMVRTCLEPDLDRRYRSAEALREDLQRQLHDLPLKHAANPSPVERLTKWRRRHPRLLSVGSLTTAMLVLLVAFSALWSARGKYVARLEAQQQYEQFIDRLPSARMAVSLPGSEEELLAQGVAEVVATLRPYGLPEAEDWQALPRYANLPPSDRTRLDDQLVELTYLAAQGESSLARLSDDEPVANSHLERALRFNDIACDCLGTGGLPHALALQRDEVLAKLGRSLEVLPSAPARDSTPIDDYLDVQFDLIEGDYANAEPLLETLRTRHPTDPVVWLLLGNVKAALGHLPEAEGCYTAAVSLQPSSYVAVYNRALCRTQLKDFGSAFDDFARVLALEPELPCVLLNRALAYEASGDLTRALADLDAAIAWDNVPPRAYLLRSRIRDRLGDAGGAEVDRIQGMKEEPRDEIGWVARGVARLAEDPDGALDDFRQALALNPRSRIALKNIVHVTADRLDRREEAMEALDSWLTIDPTNSGPLIGRAVLKGRLGARNDALADLDAALQASQEPMILFQAACTLSLTSKPDNRDGARGLLMLSRAIELDPRLLRRAETDPDLETLRAMSEYDRIVVSNRDRIQLNRDLTKNSGSPNR